MFYRDRDKKPRLNLGRRKRNFEKNEQANRDWEVFCEIARISVMTFARGCAWCIKIEQYSNSVRVFSPNRVHQRPPVAQRCMYDYGITVFEIARSADQMQNDCSLSLSLSFSLSLSIYLFICLSRSIVIHVKWRWLQSRNPRYGKMEPIVLIMLCLSCLVIYKNNQRTRCN